jgi:hypothetical protein
MSVSSTANKVITNKYVLYFVVFLAITSLLGYMVMGDVNSIFFFAIVSYLIYNFSQNMVIVLGAGLILTNILMVGKKVREGMEGGQTTTSSSTTTDSSTAPTTPTDQTGGNTELQLNSSVAAAAAGGGDTNTQTHTDTRPTEGGAVGGATAGEGMNVMSNKTRNRTRIDYASTIEDAYDDLNKILGSDGIKNLTNDTQNLMQQQMQLAEAMNNMAPLMENAQNMLKGLDMSNLSGLSDMAKSLGMGGSKK